MEIFCSQPAVECTSFTINFKFMFFVPPASGLGVVLTTSHRKNNLVYENLQEVSGMD
jgi:hypothetical protein